MDTIAVWQRIDGARVSDALDEACERLNAADREVVLDFSAVSRVAPDALTALERLAAAAEKTAVKVTLRGVSLDVYRVLKLAKLTARFPFIH